MTISLQDNFPVYFDADGTLLDSLTAHGQFCRDMNERFKCRLVLPDLQDLNGWRAVVGSPMKRFMQNAGFSYEMLEELVRVYETEFSKDPRYKVKAFSGIYTLLRKLKNRNIPLGIITSNCRENVQSSLRGVFGVFDEITDRSDLDKYNLQEGRKLESWEAKARALRDVAQRFGISSDRLTYVGDTQPDYKAAVSAKTGFIWAAYCWQDPGQREGVISARSIKELSALLLKD